MIHFKHNNFQCLSVKYDYSKKSNAQVRLSRDEAIAYKDSLVLNTESKKKLYNQLTLATMTQTLTTISTPEGNIKVNGMDPSHRLLGGNEWVDLSMRLLEFLSEVEDGGGQTACNVDLDTSDSIDFFSTPSVVRGSDQCGNVGNKIKMLLSRLFELTHEQMEDAGWIHSHLESMKEKIKGNIVTVDRMPNDKKGGCQIQINTIINNVSNARSHFKNGQMEASDRLLSHAIEELNTQNFDFLKGVHHTEDDIIQFCDENPSVFDKIKCAFDNIKKTILSKQKEKIGELEKKRDGLKCFKHTLEKKFKKETEEIYLKLNDLKLSYKNQIDVADQDIRECEKTLADMRRLVQGEDFVNSIEGVSKMMGDRFFHAEDWKKLYGVTISDWPSLPDNIGNILLSPCAIHPDQQVKDTHYLMLIPKYIEKDGEKIELTLSSYGHPRDGLVGNIREGGHGNRSQIIDYHELFSPKNDQRGNEKFNNFMNCLSKNSNEKNQLLLEERVERTKWVLFYGGNPDHDILLIGSQNKSWLEQGACLDNLNKKMASQIKKSVVAMSDQEKVDKIYHISKLLESVVMSIIRYNKIGDGVFQRGQIDEPIVEHKASYVRSELSGSSGFPNQFVSIRKFSSEGLGVFFHSDYGVSFQNRGISVLRNL